MDIRVRRVGAAVIVEIDGPLGAGDSEKLFERRVGQLIEHGERSLVLDLSRVSRVDSIGLGGLIQVLVRIRTRGGGLKLAAPTPFLRNLLRITKLTTVFEICDSVDSALSAHTLAP